MVEDTLLTEIKEEVGRERMERFFKRFGKAIIGLIAFIIIGFGSYELWKYQAEKSRQKAGNEIFSVLSNLESNNNIERLDNIEDGKGFSQLADLSKAKILTENGEIDQAVKVYREIYDNKSNDISIRDLAKLNEVKIMLNTDSSNPKIEDDLLKIIPEGRPFRYSALEMLAIYEAENGNSSEAKEIYQQLVEDKETPTTINLRAKDSIKKITATEKSGQENES